LAYGMKLRINTPHCVERGSTVLRTWCNYNSRPIAMDDSDGWQSGWYLSRREELLAYHSNNNN